MVERVLAHDHSPESIARRLEAGPRQSYLRDWVYGGIDGSVTTFAVVSGVVGAQLSPATILVLGVANVVADGFAMAAGNYLGTKSEHDEFELVKAYETKQVKGNPRGEREEVRQILARQGFDGDLLERALDMYTADSEKWVRLMLTEEYGLPTSTRCAWRAGWTTFSAFAICGAVPLLPYFAGHFVSLSSSFAWSCGLTALNFFLIGSLKSRWAITSWWRQGLQTLLVGGMAAGLAYGLGVLMRGFAGGAGG